MRAGGSLLFGAVGVLAVLPRSGRNPRERGAAPDDGVDLTAIPTIGTGTALTVAAEIGPDFSAFPSVQHFCSWLGVAPGTRISNGVEYVLGVACNARLERALGAALQAARAEHRATGRRGASGTSATARASPGAGPAG